jgi:hypothetical protein
MARLSWMRSTAAQIWDESIPSAIPGSAEPSEAKNARLQESAFTFHLMR